MAKIVGYSPSTVAVPAFMQRAQQVSIMGVGSYEGAGTVERQYAPYIGAFGQAQKGYDLNQPGAVSEIKDVLVELARYFSDSTNRPDPATETIWKHIDRSADFKDAWDGPTADELVLMVGRLRDLGPTFGDPAYIQLKPVDFAGQKSDIVGGPQPTVQGLELLAQAAQKYLKGEKQLHRYLAWRGGSLNSWFSGPPDSFVKQCHTRGRAWNPRGWTQAWLDGTVAKKDPNLLGQLDLAETSLKTSWGIAPYLTDEKQRAERANYLTSGRLARHDIVKQLNAGAPDPSCANPAEKWSSEQGACVDRCPEPDKVWDTATGVCAYLIEPPDDDKPYHDYDSCLAEHLRTGFDKETSEGFCSLEYPKSPKAKSTINTTAVVVVGATLGLAAWWYFTADRK